MGRQQGFFALLVLAAIGLVAVPAAVAQTPRVLVVELENDVNPVTADYFVGELERAQEEGLPALVI